MKVEELIWFLLPCKLNYEEKVRKIYEIRSKVEFEGWHFDGVRGPCIYFTRMVEV